MTTRARLLQVNTRRSDIPCTAAQKWRVRRPKLVKVIVDCAPSILTVQECTVEIEKDLLKDLSKWSQSVWKLQSYGNSGVLWNTAKWSGSNMRDFALKAPTGLTRRLALVDLTSVATKGKITVGASHLSVHFSTSAAWRIKQADQICQILKGDLNVVGADLNSANKDTQPGPRQEFKTDQSMLGLREKCTTKVIRADYDTHHGFKPTKRNGRWLDEVETGKAIKVYAAEVVLTGSATDHNGLLARFEF